MLVVESHPGGMAERSRGFERSDNPRQFVGRRYAAALGDGCSGFIQIVGHADLEAGEIGHGIHGWAANLAASQSSPHPQPLAPEYRGEGSRCFVLFVYPGHRSLRSLLPGLTNCGPLGLRTGGLAIRGIDGRDLFKEFGDASPCFTAE